MMYCTDLAEGGVHHAEFDVNELTIKIDTICGDCVAIDIRKILHELSELHNVTRTTEDKTVDLNVTESGLYGYNDGKVTCLKRTIARAVTVLGALSPSSGKRKARRVGSRCHGDSQSK